MIYYWGMAAWFYSPQHSTVAFSVFLDATILFLSYAGAYS